MWDEQKGQRYEELRKREDSLGDEERSELTALQRELEGLDTSIASEDTNRKIRDLQRHSNRPDENAQSGFRAFAINHAGAISVIAGSIASIATFLVPYGISPFYVSTRESGWDLLRNHFCCVGPFVLIGWTAIL
jgi:Zn-dependent M16 (insulinase) family peptidase